MTDASNALPDGWAWVPLGRLAAQEPNAMTDGPFGSNLKSEHYTSNGPRVIRLQNIGDGVFRDERAHISEAHFRSLSKHAVKSGDVVIAMLGDRPPRACVVPPHVPPAIVKADCVKFRPDLTLVSPQYVSYALNSESVKRGAIIHGVGRPRLNLRELRELLIPVAPRQEQEVIVAEIEKQFTRLDAAVASLEQAQAKLKSHRRAALRSALDPHLQGDEAGTWQTAPIGRLCDIQLGKMLSPKAHESGLVVRPYLRNENVRWGHVETHDLKEMGFKPTELERYSVANGDLLVCEGGEPGRCAIYDGGVPSLMYQKALHRVRCGPELSVSFLRYWFEAFVGTRAITSRVSQTTIAHLPLEEIRALTIAYPERSTQERIVISLDGVLAAAERTSAELRVSLIRSERLRRAVLSAAFCGRLLSPASIETMEQAES